MTPEITATHEAPPVKESIEHNPPSLALQRRIATGEFDAPPTGDIPTKINDKSLTALRNQNEAKRKEDEEKFAREHQKLPPGELRHEQMKVWSINIWGEMGSLVEAKQQKVFESFHKLGVLVKPNGNSDEEMHEMLKQFYDADAHTEGAFYKKFCTGNMNERLAEVLEIDDMFHLKTFLTKWMLGSDDAFDALVALRHTKDSIADSIKRQAMLTATPIPTDDHILDFY
ncbi:MAG: hypothetical protein KGL95_05850, partial [Patescibacteria group bacterium]|nr:hypothetical protein [Patescibacteria group bacterium]